MAHLFRNSSSGALTREQAVALEKKRAAERRHNQRQAGELAAQGRGNDTQVAHVALGEIVLPKMLQTPNVLNAIRHAAQDAGIPLGRLRIGSSSNSINPETEMPEFGLMDAADEEYQMSDNSPSPPANDSAVVFPSNSFDAQYYPKYYGR